MAASVNKDRIHSLSSNLSMRLFHDMCTKSFLEILQDVSSKIRHRDKSITVNKLSETAFLSMSFNKCQDTSYKK